MGALVPSEMLRRVLFVAAAVAAAEAFMAPASLPATLRPARAVSPLGLRMSWQKIVDPASGDPYWWNEQTGESTWEEPAAAAPAAPAAPAAKVNVNQGLTSLSAPGGNAIGGSPTDQINTMMAKQIAREEAREAAMAEKKAREAAALAERPKKRQN